MIPTVRGSQGKIRRSEKVREFGIPESGETQRVRKFKSITVQKFVNKDAGKILNCCTLTA